MAEVALSNQARRLASFPMNTISADTLFAPPSRLSLTDLDASMTQFNDRIQSTLGSGGHVEDLPLSPWGGNLSDAGVRRLGGPGNGMGGASNSSLARGNDFGAKFVSKAASAPAAQPPGNPQPAANQQPSAPKAPPFPGRDGDLGDYVEWATYYNNLKAKFPGLDASFPELKDYARDWLIEQGVSYAKEKFDKLIKDSLTSWLQSDYLDDAIKTANAESGGILDKIQARIEEEWAKYEGIFSDPAQWLSDKFFKDGLPYLANLGMDKLFGGIWAVDAEKSSALEYMAHMAAKAIVQEIVNTLLAGVKDLETLMQNFTDLQKNLFKKIDEFFGGRQFVSGSASVPVARKLDKDDKVDAVMTGLSTVVVEGLEAARVTDLMFPSGKGIKVGSATVLAGELPLARFGSSTEIPSLISAGASAVLVEGVSAGAAAPGGGLYCPTDPGGGPLMSPITPSGVSALAGAGIGIAGVASNKNKYTIQIMTTGAEEGKGINNLIGLDGVPHAQIAIGVEDSDLQMSRVETYGNEPRGGLLDNFLPKNTNDDPEYFPYGEGNDIRVNYPDDFPTEEHFPVQSSPVAISPEQYETLINFTKEHGDYDLQDSNCVNYAVDAYNTTVGEPIYSAESEFTIPSPPKLGTQINHQENE
jgi:uncharacterized Zn-binding protein involved in type VI secretion